MTKTQFRKKYKDLFFKDIRPWLLKEGERLIKSGGIEVEEAENDYVVPKTVLYVALNNFAWQYRPLTKKSKERAKNLEKF